MAVRIIDAPIKELLGENLTVNGSGGAVLYYALRHGWREVLIEPQAAVRLALAPAIQELWFYDNSATTKWVSLNKHLTNRHVDSDTGTTLDSAQAADYLYIGFVDISGGVYVDMDGTSVNGTTSAMAGGYTKSDGTFAALSVTDGTASGGATLAQDGAVTWTVPTDWIANDLPTVLSDSTAPSSKLFWVRLSFGSGLDSDTEIEQLIPIAQNSNRRGYFKASVEYTIDLSSEVGALEVLAQGAGGTSVNVTWIRR